MNIGQDIEKLIDQRIDLALKQRDEKICLLETEKKHLIRLASELKNEMKNMKVTVAMYEKQITGSNNCFRRFAHKCVGCDIKSFYEDVSKEDLSLNSSNSIINNSHLKERKNLQTSLNTSQPNLLSHSTVFNTSSVSNLKINKPSQLNGLNSIKKEPQFESTNENLFSGNPSTLSQNVNSMEVIEISDEEEPMEESSKSMIVIKKESCENEIEFESIEIEKKVPLPPILSYTITTKEINGEVRNNAIFTITNPLDNYSEKYAKVEKYIIFMGSKKNGDLDYTEKIIGTVTPTYNLPLVGFTASHLRSNFKYYFKVMPIDKLQRKGNFSDKCHVSV